MREHMSISPDTTTGLPQMSPPAAHILRKRLRRLFVIPVAAGVSGLLAACGAVTSAPTPAAWVLRWPTLWRPAGLAHASSPALPRPTRRHLR